VQQALAGRHGDHDGDWDDDRDDKPAYRLYEVQNGNHIETYRTPPQAATPPAGTFPQLEFIQPHAQRAFDLLVDSVEHRATLPPSQCIPHGGAISATPTRPGHCANLFE
jgi:hypothetical protein